jgi:hypothetical protein
MPRPVRNGRLSTPLADKPVSTTTRRYIPGKDNNTTDVEMSPQAYAAEG